MRAAWLLAPPALFLALFFAFPLVLTSIASFNVDSWSWVAGPYVRNVLLSALSQATLSVVFCLAVALPLAWFHHVHDLRFGRIQMALHAVPFVMPVFVVVYGIEGLLGPRSAISHAAGRDLLAAIGPLATVALAHAYYNYGFAARLLHGALERRPHQLEAAARTLGASHRAALWRVTLPILAPAVGAVALLVFLFSFASFATVFLLGNGVVRTLETEIYAHLGLDADYGRAGALGLLQLALNAALLGIYIVLRRRNLRLAPEPAQKTRKRWAVPASWLFVGVGLSPIAQVLVEGFRLGGSWSLAPWRHLLFDHPLGFDFGAVVLRSLGYALASMLLAMALTVLLAYGVRKLPNTWQRLGELFTGLPMAASSLLIGLGFTIAFGPRTWLDLYGTPWIVILAHTFIGFPFVARALLPALEAHDPRIDEAATLLGASTRSLLARIHFPLLRRPILVAAGFAAALSLGDF